MPNLILAVRSRKPKSPLQKQCNFKALLGMSVLGMIMTSPVETHSDRAPLPYGCLLKGVTAVTVLS